MPGSPSVSTTAKKASRPSARALRRTVQKSGEATFMDLARSTIAARRSIRPGRGPGPFEAAGVGRQGPEPSVRLEEGHRAADPHPQASAVPAVRVGELDRRTGIADQ